MRSTKSICLMTVALTTALGLNLPAQVKTEVPAVVAGAKPATVEHIKIHGMALEGNLEGDAVERDVIVFHPPSYAKDTDRHYPVVYALHGYSIRYSMRDSKQARLASSRITVKILTGSEKEKFLSDAELAKLLAGEGITITLQKTGSREIATRPDLKSFDVAYPAGAHAAVKIAQTTGSKRSYATFYTPMAVASWKTLVPVLEASGLVSHKAGAYFIVDMARLVEMMRKGTRWRDLPGNTVYALGKSVLATSTDVRKSNSGGMYLALAA